MRKDLRRNRAETELKYEPGVFDGVGTIVIMVIGIFICIGALFGTEFFENRVLVGDGKHYYRRRY